MGEPSRFDFSSPSSLALRKEMMVSAAKVWDSSVVVAAYLTHRLTQTHSSETTEATSTSSTSTPPTDGSGSGGGQWKRCVELGSGCGLIGSHHLVSSHYASVPACGSKRSPVNCFHAWMCMDVLGRCALWQCGLDVIATDRHEIVPLLQQNLRDNCSTAGSSTSSSASASASETARSPSPRTVVHMWGTSVDPILEAAAGPVDLVVAGRPPSTRLSSQLNLGHLPCPSFLPLWLALLPVVLPPLWPALVSCSPGPRIT